MPGFRDQDRSCQFVLGDAEGFAQLDGARRGASAGFGNLHDVVFREACGCGELLIRSVVALLDEKLKRFGDGIEIRGYKYRPDFFKGYFQGIGKLHSRRVRAAAMERDRIHGDRVEAVDLAEMAQRLDSIATYYPASRQKITQSPETKQTLLLKALFNRGFFLAPRWVYMI